MLEPLSVACHAVRRAQVVPESSCLVIGAGAVGLLCAAVARFKGCSKIAICDVDKRRVDFALQNGFAQIGMIVERQVAINIEEELANARALARNLGDLVWPDGGSAGQFSVVFECTGVPSCVQSSIYVSGPLSRLSHPSIDIRRRLPSQGAGSCWLEWVLQTIHCHCPKPALEKLT